VKFFIFILIFVFDPLAVMLVVAFNQALLLREEKESSAEGNQVNLITKKAKSWWEVYGETKDKILKREDIDVESEPIEEKEEDEKKTSKKNSEIFTGRIDGGQLTHISKDNISVGDIVNVKIVDTTPFYLKAELL